MALWRTVRVFLSSTFRDMHGERDHLVKVVFPRLRERLLPFRIELIDVDLRWGITAEQAENEKVLSLCLEQIDECRPFFLGFLGHRYGWVPPRLPSDARTAFPWIDDQPGASVTELEMLHGALRPDILPARALFCLRDEPALRSIPEATRNAIFRERDLVLAGRLDGLKGRLRGSGHPVGDYSARWDGDLYDRSRGRGEMGRLTDLDGFGTLVEDWLWQAIRKHCALPDTPPPADPLAEEADLHERFMEARLRVYVGRTDLNDALHAFARGGDEVPCLLAGPSGSGKSAALAHFVQTFRGQHPEPETVVLAHFVGASATTTALPAMLGRLCHELKRHFGFALPVPDAPAERVTAFLALLASVPEDRRLVLVLDALNQLDDGAGAESLHWLPERLPAHVKVIASCVNAPGRAPAVLGTLGERGCHTLEMKPLTEDDRRAILHRVPKVAAKTLDERQAARLLANPATANPLFLLTALEELRLYGSFDTLDARIDALPSAGDTVTALFEQVFARLEDEFEGDLVEAVLSLLACARRGLSDAALRELTRDCRGAGELFPVLRQLRPYLLSRAGRWDFYHTSVRRAVEQHYLKRDPDATAPHPTAEERRARQRLVRYFQQDGRRLEARGIEELPWQLAALRDWQRLWELLADLPFFAAACEVSEFEVRELWARLEAESSLRMVEAYRPAIDNPARHEVAYLGAVAYLLQRTGHLEEAGLLRGYLVKHYHDVDERKYAEALRNQALIRKVQGDLEGAMRLLKEVEEICRRLNDPAGLSTCLGNQAVILAAQGDLEGAMHLHRLQEEICRRLNDPAGLSRSICGQALILAAQGDLEGAMRLHKQEEEICRRLNDPAGLSRSICGQALIRKAQGDLEGAMHLHRQQEEICRRLNDPAGLQACLGNQALILRARGNLEGAMRLHKEEEEICRRLNDPAGLKTCLGNEALILHLQGDLEGAMRLHRENEENCRRLNDPAGLSYSLGNQAEALRAQGDLEGAMRLNRQVEEICRRLSDPNGLAICLANQADLLAVDQGQPLQALPLAEESYRLATQHGLVGLARQIQPILDEIRKRAGA